ncbi:MAG: N-acetylmuramoyl-L-alanine amidase family protein [Halanaerobiales bacterium]
MYIIISINKIRLLFSTLIIVGFIFALSTPFYRQTEQKVTGPASNLTIIIDPGHGSIDTGSSYKNIYEKDINLAVGKKLKSELSRQGFNTVLTRKKDKLYQNDRQKDIQHRPKFAEIYDAQLFISIHVNEFTSPQPTGSQVFFVPGSEESKKLATFIKKELVKLRKENNRPLTPGNYYVLKNVSIPAVLIETGFISNPRDRKLLTAETYQKKMARAISNGIKNYIQQN